jgi:hypothetical protein
VVKRKVTEEKAGFSESVERVEPSVQQRIEEYMKMKEQMKITNRIRREL